MNHVKAQQGQWYSDRSTREIFCVIAVDESDGLIDVRDGYGDIDEFDLAEWDAMDLEPCTSPEDWRRSWEDSEAEDGDFSSDTHQMRGIPR